MFIPDCYHKNSNQLSYCKRIIDFQEIISTGLLFIDKLADYSHSCGCSAFVLLFSLNCTLTLVWRPKQPDTIRSFLNPNYHRGGGVNYHPLAENRNFSGTKPPLDLRPVCKLKFVRCGPGVKNQSALSFLVEAWRWPVF